MKSVSQIFVLPITILLINISFTGYGQQTNDVISNGFHIGVYGEGNLAQKMSCIITSGDCPAPISHATTGWKAGGEVSYNFANFFEVSIGVTYGSVAQYHYDIFAISADPDIHDNRFGLGIPFRRYRLQIPVRFGIHTPITRNWAIYSAIGINIQNVPQAIEYAWGKHKGNVNNYLLNKYNDSQNITWSTPEGVAYRAHISDNFGHRIRTDLTFNIGFYYRLPYADLIRVALSGNIALSEKLTGVFEYTCDKSIGSLSYSHNYVGLEIAYLHCFKTKVKQKN